MENLDGINDWIKNQSEYISDLFVRGNDDAQSSLNTFLDEYGITYKNASGNVQNALLSPELFKNKMFDFINEQKNFDVGFSYSNSEKKQAVDQTIANIELNGGRISSTIHKALMAFAEGKGSTNNIRKLILDESEQKNNVSKKSRFGILDLISRAVSDKKDPYVNNQTGIYRNLAGITNRTFLKEFESGMSATREIDMRLDRARGGRGGFDMTHLHNIHSALFKDVYPWAGEVRKVNIAGRRDITSNYLDVSHLNSEMMNLKGYIEKNNRFNGLSKGDFAKEASKIMLSLTKIAPFRDGNERVINLFMTQLATQAGHEIDLTKIDQKTLRSALHEGIRNLKTETLAFVIENALRHNITKTIKL